MASMGFAFAKTERVCSSWPETGPPEVGKKCFAGLRVFQFQELSGLASSGCAPRGGYKGSYDYWIQGVSVPCQQGCCLGQGQ
jgi:hypothetical protein